jgi:hypothetical protein
MKEPLNEFTSFNTIILYIFYSFSKRLFSNQTFIIILILAWVFNICLLTFSLSKKMKGQEVIEKSTKFWFCYRVILNLVYLYLTCDLLDN